MTYSLQGIKNYDHHDNSSTQNSTDYKSMNIDNSNPIEFYKMAKSREYEIQSYDTVSTTGLFDERMPFNPQTEVSNPSSMTKPKATYPKAPLYGKSNIPNKPEVIYHEPYNQITHMESYPIPTVNSYSMVAPELDQSIFHMPVGVPFMPLYGYDSYDDFEKDYDYIKQLFPLTAKKLLFEITDECDKLEYEGSCMFDEYPDRIYLGRIIDRIYEKTKHLFDDSVHAAEMQEEYARRGFRRPDRRPHNANNPIRDLIEILFFNEILNRRRRFRGRRHWY